jgi:maltose-binding protein MalE
MRKHYPSYEANSICFYYLKLCVSAEAETINQFHQLCLTPQRPESTIYYTRGEHANHYITYTVWLRKGAILLKKSFQHKWHHAGICAKNVGTFEFYPTFVTTVYTFLYSIVNWCQYFMDFFRIIFQLCPLYGRYFFLCLLNLHPLYRTEAVNRRTANSMAKKKQN